MCYIIKLYPKLPTISISSFLFQIFLGLVVLLNFPRLSSCELVISVAWSEKGLRQRRTYFCVFICHFQRQSL